MTAETLRAALERLTTAAASVIACGVGNLSPPKYGQRVEAFDALDDALDEARAALEAEPVVPDHFHDPFDPAAHAEWLATLGHKPLPDGRCEHRWRNRTSRAVRCAFLDGFRAALSAPNGEPVPDEPEIAAHEWVAHAIAAVDDLSHEWHNAGPGGMTVGEFRARIDAIRTALAALSRPVEADLPDADGQGLSSWAQKLVKAERENTCGDLACQTRRTAAAIAVLTGWKEHQDLCWAVEAFQVEIGVRDPALLGKEPENVPTRGAIEAEAFERGRLFAITGSGTQTATLEPRQQGLDVLDSLAEKVAALDPRPPDATQQYTYGFGDCRAAVLAILRGPAQERRE